MSRGRRTICTRRSASGPTCASERGWSGSKPALPANALLDRFPRFELAAEPVPVRHMIRNSWHDMPVIFAS